ncbi:MAG: c-type cytochrome [Desulfobacterales bacterium]|nr:c-type cytochrome [Desulfobacterales bacterium]
MVVVKKTYLYLVILLCIAAWAFAHGWMAPKKEAEKKNPIKKDEQTIHLGQTIFSEFCMDCHGKDAKGMGSGAVGLDSPPPDLQKTLKSHSDGDFFWKIKTGRKEMPSFKNDLEEKEIWSVIHYLRSLGQSSDS